MPSARGLFRRAILQSGTANRLGDRESGARLAAEFLAELGLKSATCARLWELPFEKILEAQLALSRRLASAARALPFGPIWGGETLPTRPLDLVREGGARDVEVIVGTNRDEVKLFAGAQERPPLDDARLEELIRASIPQRFSEHAARIVESYRVSRKGRLPTSNQDLLDAIQTDLRFRLPVIRLAEAQRAHQPRTHLYLFVWESSARRGALGACHALELPFVFGTLDAPTQDRFAGTGPEVERLSRNMMDAWVAFARRGDPSHTGIGTWASYETERRDTMIFGRESGLAQAPFEEERALWDELLHP